MVARLKVLYITPWYPQSADDVSGTYVREHAKAAAIYNDVVVLHCLRGHHLEVRPRLWRVEQEKNEGLTEGIPTYRSWHGDLPGPMVSTMIYVGSVFQGIRTIVQHGFRPDLIHAHVHLVSLPAAALSRAYHIPFVISEHSSSFHSRTLSRLQVVEARVGYRLATYVLPVSGTLHEAVSSYGIRARFKVVPNPVDTSVFFPSGAPQSGAPCARILFVGRLVPTKGVDYLLNALKQVLPQFDNWALDIVGDGPQRAAYEELAAELGLADRVTFHRTRSRSEVAEFMRRADLFVLPSLVETFGCVLIEAMATGLPIVATRVGGIPEVVDERAVLLVPPADVQALARAISSLLEQPRAASHDERTLSVLRVQHLYSKEAIGRTYDTLYRQVVGSAP